MVDVFSNIVGVIAKWVIGSVTLKDTSGVLNIRNETDTGYNNVRAADPVVDQDLVTKGSLKTVPYSRTTSFVGIVTNIGTGATKDGDHNETVMIEDGEIVGISAYVVLARTAGTTTFYSTINGVAQNISGQYCIIDGTNTRRVYLSILSPIQYTAGQSLGCRCVTDSFSPNNTNAVVQIFIRGR